MTSRIRSYFITAMVVVFAGLAMTATTAWAQVNLRGNVPGNEEGISLPGGKILRRSRGAAHDGQGQHQGAPFERARGIRSARSSRCRPAPSTSPRWRRRSPPSIRSSAPPRYPISSEGREHVAKALAGPAGQLIEERLAAKGLRVLGFLEGGFRQITNNIRPINTPADLKGVKMRTPGSKLRIKIFNHYGANASPLPFKELYTALQTGVFDGQENPVIWARRPSSTKCRSIFRSPITSTPSPTC